MREPGKKQGKVNFNKVLAHAFVAGTATNLGPGLEPLPLNTWTGAGLALAMLLTASLLIEWMTPDTNDGSEPA